MTTLDSIINEAIAHANASCDAATATAAPNADPVIEEARNLADRLERLPSQTSESRNIKRICSEASPDRCQLRAALLNQCREITDAKTAHSGRSAGVLAGFADLCFDLAMRC